MVSVIGYTSNTCLWAGQRVDSVDTDGDDFPDNQSNSSASLSDDGSSQDSASTTSTAPSSYAASRGDATSLSRVNSNESPYSTSLDCVAVQTASALKWVDTVSSANAVQPVPPEQRQNPRRTAASSTAVETRQPPCSLIRQEQRKNCFVAILVGFATQFVEAIWPLAACTPRTDTCFFGRGVLPLRTFITETLRRSRTSYSTLQVALYYLVLIKDHLPKANFCTEQPCADAEFRSMQCGRRMFLTALILASKYLQDRNYSTRAWSKISGLRAKEIHFNEMHYCKTIDWKLHIPQEKFQRWSRIVLRLSAPTAGPGSDTICQQISWPMVLKKLNPELTETFENLSVDRRATDFCGFTPTTNFTFGDSNLERTGADNAKPKPLEPARVESIPEPNPFASSYSQLSLEPERPQPHNLPTPQTTPQLQGYRSFCHSQTSSMSTAMSQARQQWMIRATLDRCPPPTSTAPVSDNPSPERVRRPSFSQSISSLASSPESMISDAASVSSRASRSSSICSVASSTVSSLNRRLDRIACRKAAGLADARIRSNESFKYSEMVKSDWAILPAVQDLSVDMRSDFGSPMSYERPSSSNSTRSLPYDPARPPKSDLGLQDLEAAAALCKLRPSEAELYRMKEAAVRSIAPQLSSENTPLASRLNRSISSSRESSPSEVTPRPFGQPLPSEASTPQTCHKRSHSKAADPLQDMVRSQLLRSIHTDLPDRSARDEAARRFTPQSPSLTYGIAKKPIAVADCNGSKRTCFDDSRQVSAVDLTRQYLRSHLSQISHVPLVNTPS